MTDPEGLVPAPSVEPMPIELVGDNAVEGKAVESKAVESEAVESEVRPRAKAKQPKGKTLEIPKADLSLWRADRRPALREDGAGKIPGAPGDGNRKTTELVTKALRERLRQLQARMIAEQSQALLVVLQAMDTGGKDGTVKNIYLGINPAAAAVRSFSFHPKTTACVRI